MPFWLNIQAWSEEADAPLPETASSKCTSAKNRSPQGSAPQHHQGKTVDNFITNEIYSYGMEKKH
jgi:hypothetical protein